jgi:hypothetical protein
MAVIYRIIIMLKCVAIDHLPEHLLAETVISVVEWPGFEKTAGWNCRPAECLLGFKRFQDAE